MTGDSERVLGAVRPHGYKRKLWGEPNLGRVFQEPLRWGVGVQELMTFGNSQNFPGPQFPAPLNTRTNDYSLLQGGYEAKGGGRALCCFLGMARTPAPRSHSFQEEKAEQGRAALGSTRAETRSPLQLLKK